MYNLYTIVIKKVYRDRCLQGVMMYGRIILAFAALFAAWNASGKEPELSDEVKLLMEIRDLLKNK